MKIPHFEDSSNDSQDYFRNRVRHQYLPEFEKENPQMQVSLLYLAEEVTHWHQALKELTSELTIQDLSSFRTYSHSVPYQVANLEIVPDTLLIRMIVQNENTF